MKKNTLIFPLAFLCLAVTSCRITNGTGTIERQPQFSSNGTLQPTLFTIKTDATQRVGVIMADNGHFKVLLENSPDAALNAVASLAAKASINGNDSASINAALTKTIDKLTNRTDAMQQQRDALFYLAELYFGGATADAEVMKQFNVIINNTKELSEKEALNNQASANISDLEKLVNDMADSDTKTKLSDAIKKLKQQ